MDNFINEEFVNELCKSGVWETARIDVNSVNEASNEEVEETAEVNEEEKLSASELAEQLFMELPDEIILEFIDVLHESMINEERGMVMEAIDEMEEEDLDALISEAFDVLEEEFDLSEFSDEELDEAIMDEITKELIGKAAASDVKAGYRRKMGSPSGRADYRTIVGGGGEGDKRVEAHTKDWVGQRAEDLKTKLKKGQRKRALKSGKVRPTGAELDTIQGKAQNTSSGMPKERKYGSGKYGRYAKPTR